MEQQLGGYLLATYAPWLDYDEAAMEARSVFEESSMDEPMRVLIQYATMAANGHNAQAWKFAVGEGEITLLPDRSRRLAVVDPEDRELWISLGCALENLLIAARASGYDAEVSYPDGQEFVRVKLEPDLPLPDPLFEAIPLRQNTRSNRMTGDRWWAEDFARLQAHAAGARGELELCFHAGSFGSGSRCCLFRYLAAIRGPGVFG